MKNATIARNYAEALLAAGAATKQVELFGRLIDAVAGAVQADERIAVVLESPRVAKGVKAKLLEDALEGSAPREFVRFLQAVVRRGRQGLFAGRTARGADCGAVDAGDRQGGAGPVPRRPTHPGGNHGARGRPNLRRHVAAARGCAEA